MLHVSTKLPDFIMSLLSSAFVASIEQIADDAIQCRSCPLCVVSLRTDIAIEKMTYLLYNHRSELPLARLENQMQRYLLVAKHMSHQERAFRTRMCGRLQLLQDQSGRTNNYQWQVLSVVIPVSAISTCFKCFIISRGNLGTKYSNVVVPI
jgi:hypothetical protein